MFFFLYFSGPQQLHALPFSVHIAVGVYIQRRGDRRMTEYFRKTSVIDSFLNSQGSEAVPLRYNYDKPEKPRRIKGFEVFSLVFSSFSKPKNRTEISRIIGGVSFMTNE